MRNTTSLEALLGGVPSGPGGSGFRGSESPAQADAMRNQLCDSFPSALAKLIRLEAQASAADPLVALNIHFCSVRKTGGRDRSLAFCLIPASLHFQPDMPQATGHRAVPHRAQCPLKRGIPSPQKKAFLQRSCGNGPAEAWRMQPQVRAFWRGR